MLQLLMYLLIVLLTFFVGFSVVLCSENTKTNWLPISYVLGTSGLILLSFWISYLSKNGLRPCVWLWIVIVLMTSCTVVIREREKASTYFKMITISDITCMSITLGAGVIPIMIYTFFGAQFPYVDGYTYICNADYLMDNGYRELVDVNDMILHPWLSQIYLYQTQHFRIGSQMLLAFLTCLFGQSFSIEVFLPLISFSVVLLGMGAWTIIANKPEMSKATKIIAVTLMCFNVPIVLWNAMQGYLPQTMGSALFLGSLSCFLTLDKWKSKWDLVAASFFTGSFVLTYNEMLPFLVLVALTLVLNYIMRNKQEALNTIKKVGICGVIAILLILPYFPGMVKAILVQLGVVVGWNQVKDINTYLAYFMSTVPADYSFQTSVFSVFMLLAQIATVFLLVVMIVGAVRSDKNVQRDFVCVSVPYAMMLIYFLLFTENPFVGGRGNTWSIFKLMQYYFIPAVPFMAIFISRWFEKKKIVITVFVIVFIVYNGLNGVNYAKNIALVMENYVGRQEDSFEEYYRLSEKYNNSEKRYALTNVPLKHRQLITYFLKDAELVSDWDSDDYFGTIPKVPEQLYESAIQLTYDLHDEDNIAGLVERVEYIIWGEGSYAEEYSEKDYWHWCNKEAEVIINNADMEAAKFEFEVYILGLESEAETIEVYMNDNILLKKIPVYANQIVNDSIELDRGMNTLKFIYSGETSIPGNGDYRELAFAIRNYNVVQNR